MLFEAKLEAKFEAKFEVRLVLRVGLRLNLKPPPLLPPIELLFSSGLLIEDNSGLTSFGLSVEPNEKFGMLGAGLVDCCSVLPNLNAVDGALNIEAVPLLSRLPNENRLLLAAAAAGGLLAGARRVEFCCCLFRSEPNVNAVEGATGLSRLLFGSFWLLSPKLKELLDSLELLFKLLFVAAADD